MFAQPREEHGWLEQLVGNWTFEHQCQMPDGSSTSTSGKMNCRFLGKLWLICESSGQSASDDQWSSIMSLGFDSNKQRFVGTFLGSMMDFLWIYEGSLDAARKRLSLESDGPAFDGSGTCKYCDSIEIISPDEWLFESAMKTPEGTWVKFMTGRHIREAAN
jgi:hypothetical protein